MRQYNPQGYQYYQYDKGLKAQGQQIVQGLTSQLNNYSQLIETTDPTAILTDFNNKMQNIETLEQNYVDQSFAFGQQRGRDLSNQLNSGDYMAAFTTAINTMGTMAEMKRADEQLAAQKEALRQQRIQRMSDVYWKAEEFNQKMIQGYYQRAAFAEQLAEEQYNLAFVEHLQCYGEKMDKTWSSRHTNWLINTCDQPVKPTGGAIQNMFIDEDIQKRKVAERKLGHYENTGESVFLDGAISFAAAAADIKGNAENYYYLGNLYSKKSTMLAYATMLAAKEINPSYFSGSRAQTFESIRSQATDEIATAMKDNDTEYLSAFLAAGLDKSIRIEGRSMLSEAIYLDQPDAMQLVLNQYIKGLSGDQRNAKLKQVVMLCAVQNSPNCIQRFKELGFPLEFTLKGYTPIDVAVKSEAPDAYKLLLDNSSERSFYEGKYAGATVNILIDAQSNPSTAAIKFDALTDESTATRLAITMLSEYRAKPNYFETLQASKRSKSLFQQNATMQELIRSTFTEEALKPSPESKAANILDAGWIEFQSIPTMKELGISSFGSKTSLVKVAYDKKNYDLLSVLGKRFDLSTVETRGKNFILELLDASLPITTNDFEFLESLMPTLSKMENKQKLLIDQIDKIGSMATYTHHLYTVGLEFEETSARQVEMMKMTFRLFGFDKADPITDNGGTILHYRVTKFLISDTYIRWNDFCNSIDTSTKNNNGQTAMDLLNAGKKEFINRPTNLSKKDSKATSKMQVQIMEDWLNSLR